MKELVTVLTCERPDGVSYVVQTCKALYEGAGNSTPMGDVEWQVVSDGLVDAALRGTLLAFGWDVLDSADRRGPRRGLQRCLHLASALAADHLYFFEDDAVPCRNSLARMRQVAVPEDCALVSFFDGRELGEGAVPGLHPRPAAGTRRRGLWGTLALKIPRRTVEWLASRDLDSVLADRPETSDVALGRLLDRSPWPLVAHHAPSLVEHGGDVSALGTDKKRRARNFPGVEFDALTLPPAEFVRGGWTVRWIGRDNAGWHVVDYDRPADAEDRARALVADGQLEVEVMEVAERLHRGAR